MSSIAHQLLEQVVSRLRADPFWGPLPENVRRSHKTIVPREQAPAVHVIDGPERVTRAGGCARREQDFTVRLIVRDDDGFAAADPLKLEVMRRLNPSITGWPPGVTLTPEDITPDAEIADADVLAVEMAFTFRYTTGLWEVDSLVS